MASHNFKINKTVVGFILLNLALFFGVCGLMFSAFSTGGQVAGKSTGSVVRDIDRQGLQQTARDLTSSQNLVENYFVDNSSAIRLVQAIEAIGKDNEVELKINRAEEQKRMVVMNIKISGSFPAVTKALSLLENLPFSISFNKVALQKNSSLPGEKTSSWSTDVDLSANEGKAIK